MKDIANIRQDYLLAELDESSVGDDPIQFFAQWFTEAQNADVTEVNAMTLSTIGTDNKAHSRIVLLKGVEEGQFIFYTNYNSSKGIEIANNPHVSLLFFWKELQRQVRIEGTATQVSAATSSEYFDSRPDESKLGAWSSPQSQIIENRNILDANYNKFKNKFSDNKVPRPEHWGGYGVQADTIEFWQGRASRMHDRILFTKKDNASWSKCRLAP